MMIQCHHCGSQVRVASNGTGGLLAAMAMVLLVAIGGLVVYRFHATTSRDSAAIGSQIGEIGR